MLLTDIIIQRTLNSPTRWSCGVSRRDIIYQNYRRFRKQTCERVFLSSFVIVSINVPVDKKKIQSPLLDLFDDAFRFSLIPRIARIFRSRLVAIDFDLSNLNHRLSMADFSRTIAITRPDLFKQIN